ncbi:MAG: hypothetical protein KJO51_03510 [Gramella sp.]|nr:hypothetical protein [Christiangramia sp.]
MLVWKWLKCLRPVQLIKLSGFFIKQPLYIFPTYGATETTLSTCNDKFGREHHLNNKANAFRHALWNFILCSRYYRVSGSLDTSVMKCKKITDLHEELMPNEQTARLMDLHNNNIGRSLFLMNQDIDIISRLEQMLPDAIKINQSTDLDKIKNRLVYLED